MLKLLFAVFGLIVLWNGALVVGFASLVVALVIYSVEQQ